MRGLNYTDGCTAVVIMLVNNLLIAANIGDARAVLARKKSGANALEAFRLTFDHKPYEFSETKRIKEMGGAVMEGRVAGLAVSRALGDFSNTFVSAEPFIQKVNLAEGDYENQFIILACDGVWDVLSDDYAVSMTNEYLSGSEAGKLQDKMLNNTNRLMNMAAARLRDCALACNSTDNISAIVVSLPKMK